MVATIGKPEILKCKLRRPGVKFRRKWKHDALQSFAKSISSNASHLDPLWERAPAFNRSERRKQRKEHGDGGRFASGTGSTHRRTQVVKNCKSVGFVSTFRNNLRVSRILFNTTMLRIKNWRWQSLSRKLRRIGLQFSVSPNGYWQV